MKNLICAVTVLAVSTAQAGVVIHVDDDADPGGGGTSWEEAYRFLQDALADAVLNFGTITEIRVAGGTYHPDQDESNPEGSGDRQATFGLFFFLNGVAIKGGYAGQGAPNPDERNIALYETVLSGDLAGNDGPDFVGNGENSYHVVTSFAAADETSVLDGFVITGGNADSKMVANARGAGMLNVANPTIRNCLIIDNFACGGGGMMNIGSHPTLVGCRFVGNLSDSFGGGIWNENAAPTVINCMFEGNAAPEGGGIHNVASNPLVVNCTFASNGNHGLSSTSIPGFDSLIVNCVFWGNSLEEISGPATVRYSDVQGGFTGTGNIAANPLFVDPDNGDYRLSPGSPCIDAGDNTAVPEDITTDLDGNPRFLEIPETPDTGNGTLPIVDMGAYEALGGGCLAVTNQEVVCHADGTTFTVNIEGLNACTGGTTQVTFTASGGAVGQELCFTALVNDGGFCCTTQICVTIPDCTSAALPSDLDGDGIVGMADFLALLAAWGSCSDCGTPEACPADIDGDCSVGILDLLILLGNWG